jgi:FlaA1/EpsC-like NDP-sugar epimerase
MGKIPSPIPLDHAPKRTWGGRIIGHIRRDIPLALLDVCLVFGAYLGPLVLRFNGAVPDGYWRNFWTFIPLAAGIHLVSNLIFGLYGHMWRYAGVEEARRVGLAGIAAGTLVVGIDALAMPLRPLPLIVVGLGAVLSLLAFGAIRFQSRLFAFRRRTASQETNRVLLIGAGDAGAMVLRDILQDRSLGLEPVGILDDDRRKAGRSLHGVPILGTRTHLPALVERLGVDEVLLAIPSATADVVRDVAALCEGADVPLKVLPSVKEIVDGRITARDIRDLRIEDLLGREQIETDLDAVRDILRGRRVLVTGAGGSIGSEIARQVSAFQPAELILLDHDETHIHDALLGLSGTSARGLLADVRDRNRIVDILTTARPEVVFHAAAHKHVPLLEEFPDEAVQTNVLGTANVVDAALVAGVERFVLISTDKAVRPASVMGATKWFAEQIVRSVQGNGCTFCAVRFGNVLGSRGSVIPTFLGQIAKGGPVTVTDPSMGRYFMSIQEAVELVLQASALSEGGEVLTLEMGHHVNIAELARKLIRLSGRVPGRDVGIEVIGRRPGEKLVEDLVDPEEEPVPSRFPGITVSRPPVPDRPTLRRSLRELEALVDERRTDELAQRVKALATGARADDLVTMAEAR